MNTSRLLSGVGITTPSRHLVPFPPVLIIHYIKDMGYFKARSPLTGPPVPPHSRGRHSLHCRIPGGLFGKHLGQLGRLDCYRYNRCVRVRGLQGLCFRCTYRCLRYGVCITTTICSSIKYSGGDHRLSTVLY